MCLSNKHFWPLPLSGRRGGEKKKDTFLCSGFQSHWSPRGVYQNVSDMRGREWEHGGVFAFTFPCVEARLARRAQKNNEPASNLLNSSLIWDNSWCPWHAVCTTSAHNHSQNPNFSYSTWCSREKENQNKLWPLSHPQCCSCYSVSILQITVCYNLLFSPSIQYHDNKITFYLAA